MSAPQDNFNFETVVYLSIFFAKYNSSHLSFSLAIHSSGEKSSFIEGVSTRVSDFNAKAKSGKAAVSLLDSTGMLTKFPIRRGFRASTQIL